MLLEDEVSVFSISKTFPRTTAHLNWMLDTWLKHPLSPSWMLVPQHQLAVIPQDNLQRERWLTGYQHGGNGAIPNKIKTQDGEDKDIYFQRFSEYNWSTKYLTVFLDLPFSKILVCFGLCSLSFEYSHKSSHQKCGFLNDPQRGLLSCCLAAGSWWPFSESSSPPAHSIDAAIIFREKNGRTPKRLGEHATCIVLSWIM